MRAMVQGQRNSDALPHKLRSSPYPNKRKLPSVSFPNLQMGPMRTLGNYGRKRKEETITRDQTEAGSMHKASNDLRDRIGKVWVF